MTLAACGSVPKVNLPPAPADLSQKCKDPIPKAGSPLVVELKKQRNALKECASKNTRWNSFYKDVRGKHET